MEKKNFGKVLFQEYGISEWEEKCLLLSDSEAIGVLNALRNGEYNILVELVRLPYPQFACEYIKLFRDKLDSRSEKLAGLHEYLLQFDDRYKDLGYKLYIMPPRILGCIVNYIKHPEKSIVECFGCMKDSINTIDILLHLKKPLDETYKTLYSHTFNKEVIKRYIHIMSYVDAHEAEKLGLESFTFKRFNDYRGFDMEEKLKALNPLIRHITMENLGFNGSYVPAYEIEANLNITSRYLSYLLTDEFYLALTKSAGEFKNYLKLIDKKYKDDERREYACKSSFKKISDKIESSFMSSYLNSANKDLEVMDFGKNSFANYLGENGYNKVNKIVPVIDDVKHL